ncbi:hypothetical protein PUND_a3263 [Pseudoalteromonas undina]|nr:hypothetical protein PUND_a3263 [Pseudoalteromonas undina]
MLLLTQSEEAYGLNAHSLFLFFIRVLELLNVCAQNDKAVSYFYSSSLITS